MYISSTKKLQIENVPYIIHKKHALHGTCTITLTHAWRAIVHVVGLMCMCVHAHVSVCQSVIVKCGCCGHQMWRYRQVPWVLGTARLYKSIS